MIRFRKLWMLLCIVSLMAGCSANQTGNGGEEEVELLIAAAASLTDALTELKDTYESEHEQVTITFNFGSSGKLASQIKQGAPVDVFLSASVKDMDGLESDALLLDSTRMDFAENALVLIGHKDTSLRVSSFEGIGNASITEIVMGEPESVPVGRYTKDVLEHLDLWDALQNKLVMGSDVRQVLTHVELGNADLGVVYASDAFISDKVKVLAEADSSWHAPIVYPGAVVKSTKHESEAKAFLTFLNSEEGKKVLEAYGFK